MAEKDRTSRRQARAFSLSGAQATLGVALPGLVSPEELFALRREPSRFFGIYRGPIRGNGLEVDVGRPLHISELRPVLEHLLKQERHPPIFLSARLADVSAPDREGIVTG